MHRKFDISRVFRNSTIVGSVLLIIIIIAFSLIYMSRAKNLMKQECFGVLASTSNEAASKIESNLKNERSSIRMLARMIGQQKELYSNEVNNSMTAYDINSMVSNIAILSGDNTIIQSRGENISADGIMDFAEESAKGEHISSLQPSTVFENKTVLRSFVPIRKGTKITGMLFVEYDPHEMATALKPEIYDGTAQFCIVDRDSGEVLVSSWEDEMTSVADIGGEKIKNDITDGKTSYMEFMYNNQKYFASYQPLELENWEIVFIVNSDKVLQIQQNMRTNLYMLFFSEIIILFIYLLWVMYSNHKSIVHTRKIANTDALTGLQNRNMYAMFCDRNNDNAKGICCVYVDANGLHDINNNEGHVAGDRMLQFIADTLKSTFGDGNVYRIGGDEFVAFLKDTDNSEIRKKITSSNSTIEENGYHVSIGCCTGKSNEQLNTVIKSAEKEMYENKKLYYEKIGKEIRNQQN